MSFKRSMSLLITAPSPSMILGSFGWEDFPVMASLQEEGAFPGAFAKSNNQEAEAEEEDSSDATASTLELEFDDDDDDDDDDTMSDFDMMEECDDAMSSRISSDVLLTATSATEHRRVSFGKVHIRQHNIVIGLHPLAEGGYPLELGWEYNECTNCYSVDFYEKIRSHTTLRRLSAFERCYRLSEMYGDSLMEVAVREQLLREAVSNEMGKFLVGDDHATTTAGGGLTGGKRKQNHHYASCTSLSDLV